MIGSSAIIHLKQFIGFVKHFFRVIITIFLMLIIKNIEGVILQWMTQNSKFRTAKYWFQYVQYIGIVKEYIRAERTSDWLLHLSCVERLLNLFAATGHTHYTKSARIYLQQMKELPLKHPDIHKDFVEKCFHSIQRTDKFWSGLWSDLIIEQVMMRSIKSSGGLTRGRGFGESTRNQWIMTAHQFAAIDESMTDLTRVERTSSEQHKDMSEARRSRDVADFQTVYEWLKESNPFCMADEQLKSLSTGIMGKVN